MSELTTHVKGSIQEDSKEAINFLFEMFKGPGMIKIPVGAAVLVRMCEKLELRINLDYKNDEFIIWYEDPNPAVEEDISMDASMDEEDISINDLPWS